MKMRNGKLKGKERKLKGNKSQKASWQINYKINQNSKN